MTRNVALSLLLIVLLPLGLLAWFGWRAAQQEQDLANHQYQVLATAQLKRVDSSIQGYFLARQKKLLQLAPTLTLEPAALRDYLRHTPEVRQMLVLAPDGKRLFPEGTPPTSPRDRLFLERVSAITANPQLVQHGAPMSDPGAPAAWAVSSQKAASRTSSASPSGEDAANAYGWYAWHWDATLHHLFWWRAPSGQLLAFELEPSRVLADLIANLPATSSQDELGAARIRLVDASGNIAYQWGRYNPGTKPVQAIMLPLSHPLASWKLEYLSVGASGAPRLGPLGWLLGVLALGMVLTGLGVYLYREHTRHVRLAEQRVNFVNHVSHELKTPLTNIRLYAELLEQELDHSLDEADDKPRQYIEVIHAESLRLSRLIANVLNLARSQKQRLLIQPAPTCIDELVRASLEAFRPALDGKRLAIELDLQAPATVLADAEAVEQILNNLIGNVEKYGHPGGHLGIVTRQHGATTRIEVQDRGPGIPPRERERIFQPFYRISHKLSDGVAGTGIGLGIARDLARLHGGDLVLCPGAVGACFAVTLHTPAAASAP